MLTAPPPTDRLLAAVAGYGVGTVQSLPDAPLPDDAWDSLLTHINQQYLAGFLAAAIRDGAFAATDAQAQAVRSLHRQGLARVLRLEHLLAELDRRFTERGIPFILLKGSGLASRYYADPAMRLFCDLDLLVPSEHFDAAAATLSATGAVRNYAAPRRSFDRRFSKGASFATTDGLPVDLHRTLVLGPFGLTVDLPALFRDTEHVRVAGAKVEVLGQENAFVSVAMHASLGDSPPRLIPLRDVVQIARNEQFDLAAALAVAERWRVRAPVAYAVRAAASTFDLPPDPLLEWAERYQPDRREERALALYLGPSRSYQSLALASVRFVPGVRDKVSYLTSLALPQQDYVAERDGSYRARLHRSWQLLRDLRKRP